MIRRGIVFIIFGAALLLAADFSGRVREREAEHVHWEIVSDGEPSDAFTEGASIAGVICVLAGIGYIAAGAGKHWMEKKSDARGHNPN